MQHVNRKYEFSVKKCCPLLTTHLSGSPIIQNGKLVGAVTHVLINDPTTGYGIFVENMLNASSSARNELPAVHKDFRQFNSWSAERENS